MKTIGIIGCGNLGQSLLHGFNKAFPGSRIICSRRNITGLSSTEYIRWTTDNGEVIRDSDCIIIALKPFMMADFLREYGQEFSPDQVIVSVATGITIAEMNGYSGSNDLRFFRAMPNTAADVRESITALCGTGSETVKEAITTLFDSVGETVWIDEKLMESATILGACGVAYVLRFIRAMIQGGIEVGFDAKTATRIVSQTVKGAAELLIRNGSHPEAEIDKVTTPKGCTIVGLNEMEHSGFSSALIRGIVTSYQKIEK